MARKMHGRAAQNSPPLTRGTYFNLKRYGTRPNYLLLGAMQVDDSPGFVQLGSHERPFFNTAGLDVLTHKWKRLVSLWVPEFRLHLAHIHQLSGHDTVRTFFP